jgi:hypothetical protein
VARSTFAPHPERPTNVAPADAPAAEPILEGEGRNDPASLAATRTALCRAAPWLFALLLVVLLVAWFRG